MDITNLCFCCYGGLRNNCLGLLDDRLSLQQLTYWCLIFLAFTHTNDNKCQLVALAYLVVKFLDPLATYLMSDPVYHVSYQLIA